MTSRSHKARAAVPAMAVAGILAGAALWTASRPAGGQKQLQVDPSKLQQVTFNRQHPNASDADVGYGPLTINIGGGGITGVLKDALIKALGNSTSQDVGRIFPEWQPVGQPKPVLSEVTDHRTNPPTKSFRLVVGRSYEELEGLVEAFDVDKPTDAGAHVSFEDFPTSHYTHDFCFKVHPDPAYEFLLGNKGNGVIQKQIEVEWECGLAQRNGGNPASEPNKLGESFGFYSAGHRHRMGIWNWPTPGDRVHVDGLWIFDRGHPPADTEIHPPRLVAVQRHLPAVLTTPGAPGHYLVAQRDDIFASGDSSAIWNNRPGQPFFVQRVPMSEKDYTFLVDMPLPRPQAGPGVLKAEATTQLASFQVQRPGVQLPGNSAFNRPADLKFRIDKQPGDSFPVDPVVQTFPDGEPGHPTPHARVTIPWKSSRAPDTAIFARSLFLFWDNAPAHGVASNYQLRAFRVTLDKLLIRNPRGEHFVTPSFDHPLTVGTVAKEHGNCRLFAEVGGEWVFLNDIVQPKPLEGGLDGVAPNQEFPINRSFVVYVGPNDFFRVHSGGWEADGIDTIMGHLVNQYDQDKARVQQECVDSFLSLGVYENGSRDDPLGETSDFFAGASLPGPGIRLNANNFGLGSHTSPSRGVKQTDDPSGVTDPNDSFRLSYHIEAFTLP